MTQLWREIIFTFSSCIRHFRGPTSTNHATFAHGVIVWKPRRPHQTGPPGLAHDSLRTPNVHISRPRRFKHHQNSTKGPRERKKKENCGGKREKKSAKFWDPHPSGLQTSRLHPSGPTFSRFGPPPGASTFRGLHPSGAPPFKVQKFNIQKLAEVEIGRSRNWPKSKLAEVEIGRSRNWPKSKLSGRSRTDGVCSVSSFSLSCFFFYFVFVLFFTFFLFLFISLFIFCSVSVFVPKNMNHCRWTLPLDAQAVNHPPPDNPAPDHPKFRSFFPSSPGGPVWWGRRGFTRQPESQRSSHQSSKHKSLCILGFCVVPRKGSSTSRIQRSLEEQSCRSRSDKSYRDYDAINGESTEFEWNISRIHNVAAL